MQVQVLLSAPNKNKTNRNYSVRFFIFLVCNRTCDNAVHCLHTPCAPARCAAGASLPRINSPVPLLRSFYSLQVLLSAPKKTIRKDCLFSCGSGLETKLRFVGKRHCVCLPLHAVQLAQRFASKLARLCYYARFAHYKSCCPHQKKTIRKGCLFSCDSGLETKLRFVGKLHCVCLLLHAVQLAQRFASKLARLCYYARFAHYKSCCPHQS